MKRIYCKTLCTGKSFQLHKDLYTDGTININFCGAKNVYENLFTLSQTASEAA